MGREASESRLRQYRQSLTIRYDMRPDRRHVAIRDLCGEPIIDPSMFPHHSHAMETHGVSIC